MKVDPSYLTSQINEIHSRFYQGLKELPTASGLQRSFIVDDLRELLAQANSLQSLYGDHLVGQAKVKLIHMTGRSMQDFLTLVNINTHKNNLITTS